MKTETTDYAVEIPHLGALILTTWNGSIRGLKEFAPADRPFSPLIFWTFRIMVGLGVLMALTGFASLALAGAAFALSRALAASAHGRDGTFRPDRAVVRLDRDRSRPSALHRVWPLAYRRQRYRPSPRPALQHRFAAFGVVYLIVFGAAMVFLLRLMARPPSLATEGPAKDKPHRSAGITPGPAQRQLHASASSDNALSQDPRHDSRHD